MKRKLTALLAVLVLVLGLITITPARAWSWTNVWGGDEITLTLTIHNNGQPYNRFSFYYSYYTEHVDFISFTSSKPGWIQSITEEYHRWDVDGDAGGSKDSVTFVLKLRAKVLPETCHTLVSYEHIAVYREDNQFNFPNMQTAWMIWHTDWTDWLATKKPTCTEKGLEERFHRHGAKEARDADPLGHDWKEWINLKEATCLENGEKQRVCDRDNSHVEKEVIPALGHDWGDWKTLKEATCLEGGEKQRVCDRDNSHVENEAILALGHDWGDWETIAPTCTEVGFDRRVCKRDAAHVESGAPAPALGHDWEDWKEILEPTCQEKGIKQRICKRDPAHQEEQELAIVPHKAGEWTVMKLPTKREPGLEVKTCVWCGLLMDQREIAVLPATVYAHNTACTEGIRFRDENPELTKKWYMFTPVDLVEEGEQTIRIIASNLFHVGHVKLQVQDGAVTAEYWFPRAVRVRESFLTYFASLSEAGQVEPEELAEQAVAFGQPVSIAEDLDGDSKVLLYAHFVIDYDDAMLGVHEFGRNSPAYRKLVENLKAIMD